jgi:hypothetical protein
MVESAEKRPPLGKEELDLRMQLADAEESLMAMRQKLDLIEDDKKYEKMEE